MKTKTDNRPTCSLHRFLMPLFITAAGFFFFACTRAAPYIDFWTMRVVYHQIEGGIVPSLIFFVIANDPDGPDDLDELRLYHDGEGLMWKIDSEKWTKFEENGRTWIGSKLIQMPPGEMLPSGQCRAVIIDKAGERGEKMMNFETPKDSRYRFPRLTVVDGQYTAVSDYPENYILCYYSDGGFRNLVRLTSTSGSVVSLRLAQDVFSIALWADDGDNSVSALTNPVNIY